VHAHRSPVAVEHVRSGEYAAGIVAGLSDAAPDLVCETLVEEEMVLVPSDLDAGALRVRGTVPVLGIESRAATARAVARRLPALRRSAGVDLVVAAEVESFACLVAMAREGLGHALVPAGIARAMGVLARETVRLPPPGLTRPVSFVARKSALARPGVAAFREALLAALPRGPGFTPSSGGR
jgi:DNA-binding transcriptional LysR family regulator